MKLLRALMAEAIGTFALVFAGRGAIMVDAKTHQLGHVGVAITFGLVIVMSAFLLAPVAGTALGGVAYQFVRGERSRPAGEAV